MNKKYLDRHSWYVQKFTRAAIYIKNLKWDAIYSDDRNIDFGDHFLDTSVCAKVQYIILYTRSMKFYKSTWFYINEIFHGSVCGKRPFVTIRVIIVLGGQVLDRISFLRHRPRMRIIFHHDV